MGMALALLMSTGFGCGEVAGEAGSGAQGGSGMGAAGAIGNGGAGAASGGAGTSGASGGAGATSGASGVGGNVATAGSSSDAGGGQAPTANGGTGGGANEAGTGGLAAGGTLGSCSLAHRVEVPFEGSASPPLLVKSGDEFAWVSGATLASLSWSGESARTVFEQQGCANTTCDGMFGRTAVRAEAGWRLLSVDRVDQQPGIRTWRAGELGVPQVERAWGPVFSGLVSSFDFRTSRDGKRALFANGQRVVSQIVMFGLLDEEGRMLAPAQPFDVGSTAWDFLTVVPTAHAAAVSVLASSHDATQRTWLLREVDSLGRDVFAAEVMLPAGYSCTTGGAGACAIVADADGYSIALGNNTGPSRIARLRRDRPNELSVDDAVVPPGILVGALASTLVFRRDELLQTTVQTRFLAAPNAGATEPRLLFVTPPVESDLNARPQVIALEGNSIFYGYPTRDSLVIEEAACPTSF